MSSNTKSELSNRIVGSKAWLVWIWLTAGIVCLADIAVLVVLGIEGVQGAVYALPIVFLVLDVIITILSAVTNFRFKRALVAPIVYAVLKLAIVILAMGLFLGDTIIFSTTGITLWLVFEFLSIVCIILSAVFAKGSGHAFLAVVAVFTVAIIAFGVVYMLFVSTNGFFGQNKERTFEKRTLVYTYYDDNKDSLMVSDVLDGNGTIVVVPDEFNGLPVKGIDCEIFSVEDIDTVVLYCDESVEFLNTSALSYFNDSISLYADEGFVSSCRNQFYAAATSSSRMGERYTAFANSIVPLVDDDSVYVSIDVDYRVLGTLYKNSEIPDVWVASKGETFDLDDYGFEYMSHMDTEDEDDLYWCYNSFNQYILTDLTDSDGKSVIDTKISSSVNITMNLEEVYAISIAEGNDAMYSEAEHGLDLDYEDTGYRYVTDDTADSIIGEVESRTGFSFEWQNSRGKTLSTLNGNMSNKMTIYPVWTLHDPEITSIGTKNSSEASTSEFTYGNTIKFGSKATHETAGINLSYEWTYDGELKTIDSSFTIDGAYPSQSGTYCLTVTAGNDAITSLTASVSESVSITIGTRSLTLGWTVYSDVDLVYSASGKAVAYAPDTGTVEESTGVLAGDNVTISLNISDTMCEAGKYDFSAKLDEDWAELYWISNPTNSYTVTPYTLSVVWVGDFTIEYDAASHCPDHSYSIDYLNDEEITDTLLVANVSDGETNAGEYTAKITISNGNYKLDDETDECSYTITRRETTVTWDTSKTYTYNGQNQYPTAEINNPAKDEPDTLTISYYVTGCDAGEQTVKAIGISSSNYELIEDKENKLLLSCDFTIEQREVTLNWGTEFSFVYNGENHTITATTGDFVDTTSEVYLTYSYSGVSQINADTYTATASLAGGKSNNYSLNDTASQSFDITQRELDIWAVSKNKTYNGASYVLEDLYEFSNLVDGESLSSVVSISVEYFSGSSSVSKPINAGSYTFTLTPSLLSNNYKITSTYLSGTITINKATLTLSWNDKDLTYNGGKQGISASVSSGLVSGENAPTLSYAVTQNGTSANPTNAGTYTITASLGVDGANYELDSTQSTEYTIAPSTIVLNWKTETLIYNGSSQYITAEIASGFIETDSNLELNYTVTKYGSSSVTTPIDAGTYSITASLDGSVINYVLGSTTSFATYEISPRSVGITWSNLSTTYNGSVQLPTATVSDVVTGDYPVSISFTYNGLTTEPVNAGEYTVVAKSLNSNYTISSETASATFVIGKKTLTIDWTTDGNVVPTATVSGVEGTDSVRVDYTYYDADDKYLGTTAPTDAGSYRVKITLTYLGDTSEVNYTVSGDTEKKFTITA